MTRHLLLKCWLALLLVSGTNTARKRWVGESTWSEPSNWNSGLPSGCDGALIEPNQILTLAAQANIAEISFGGDSAIVFDSFSEVAFGQGSYCNEVEKNIKFYEAARDDFLAVENWEPYGELDNIDVLDIHKIPCKHDIIEVPHRQMRAELRSPVKVGAVSYGGQHLSRDQVHDWLNSPDGRNELRMLSSFVLSDITYCKPREGCECGNTASCNGTTCKTSLLSCDNPVTSPTMCCPFCGSLLTVPVNTKKSYRQLQIELSTILSHQSTPQNLKMGIDQGNLHLVIEQRADRSIIDVVDVIKQRLINSNYSTTEQITEQRSLALAKSDNFVQPQKVHTNSILLVVLACMVFCLISLGLVLLYIIRRRSSMFRPVQRNDSHMSACNTYETLEPVYETIGVSRQKSEDYYEYSQDKSEHCLYPRCHGDDQRPCRHDNQEVCLGGTVSDKHSSLTSV
ncbi:hypothetical protein ACHWQZ_G003029 [Mnemiopsis leidyi]